MNLAAIQAFIFDMDGVLYRGDVAIPGAREFLADLMAANIPFRLLNNNSGATAEQVRVPAGTVSPRRLQATGPEMPDRRGPTGVPALCSGPLPTRPDFRTASRVGLARFLRDRVRWMEWDPRRVAPGARLRHLPGRCLG